VDEDVVLSFTGNKAIALAIIKPLHRTCWHQTFSLPATNAGVNLGGSPTAPY
jgi:hypothetical protein